MFTVIMIGFLIKVIKIFVIAAIVAFVVMIIATEICRNCGIILPTRKCKQKPERNKFCKAMWFWTFFN